jgi:hypothetical protein
MKDVEREFRTLYRKLNFLYSDLEITEEIYNDAFEDFKEALMREKNIDLSIQHAVPERRTETQA